MSIQIITKFVLLIFFLSKIPLCGVCDALCQSSEDISLHHATPGQKMKLKEGGDHKKVVSIKDTSTFKFFPDIKPFKMNKKPQPNEKTTMW